MTESSAKFSTTVRRKRDELERRYAHRLDLALAVGLALGLFMYVVVPALLGEGPFAV